MEYVGCFGETVIQLNNVKCIDKYTSKQFSRSRYVRRCKHYNSRVTIHAQYNCLCLNENVFTLMRTCIFNRRHAPAYKRTAHLIELSNTRKMAFERLARG